MYPFFESIKIAHGKIFHWNLHKERIQRTLHVYQESALPWTELERALTGIPKDEIFKVRLQYNSTNFSIAYHKYVPKKINKLHLVNGDDTTYDFKYADRSPLTKLLSPYNEDEDIIIVKNGFITDTSYSNLAFFDGSRWYTPACPLLRGIKRSYLLSRGLLHESMLTIVDLHRFSKVSLINAMLDLDDLALETEYITQ